MSWLAMTSESVRATPPWPAASTMEPRMNAPSTPEASGAQQRLARVFGALRGERHREADHCGREAGDPDQAPNTQVLEADGVDGHLQRYGHPRRHGQKHDRVQGSPSRPPADSHRPDIAPDDDFTRMKTDKSVHGLPGVPQLRGARRRRLLLAAHRVPTVQGTRQARNRRRGRGLGRGRLAALALRFQRPRRGLPAGLRRGEEIEVVRPTDPWG